MTVDLHLLRKLIIFAVGEDRNVVSPFLLCLAEWFAICVKSACHMRQVICWSDAKCTTICLRLKGEMIRMTSQKHSFGKMICS